MDNMTAAGAYGFTSYSPGVVGGGIAVAQTSAGAAGEAVSEIGSQIGNIGHTNNPLFWLLVLALIFTGYIFGVFEVGVKHIGSVGVHVGRE